MRSLLFLLFAALSAPAAFALPSDELFDALKTAPTAQHAEPLEADILSAMKESGSPTADLVFERANLAAEAGEMALARELLDRVLAIKPDFSEAWLFRARLFMAEDQLRPAIEDLNEALTHEKRNFRAWTMLGQIFETLQHEKEALEAYNEALKVHPHFEAASRRAKKLEPVIHGREI